MTVKYRDDMTPEESGHMAAECGALDASYAAAARFDAAARADAAADPDRLDAFGHLSWTVGNEDWIACFDARRVGDCIEFHVVVDCESGGRVDTVEAGSVPATEDGVRNLLCLPDYWLDVCRGHYSEPEDAAAHGEPDAGDTPARWAAHLRSMLAKAPAPEPDSDANAETWWDERTVRSWRE